MLTSGLCYGQGKDTLIINSSDIDSPIYYNAEDSIYADLKNNVVHLYGDAVVDNGEIRLNAGYIMIDIGKNEVLAKYRYDADSNMIELPKFSDGSEEILAQTVRYNFNTEKAFIEEVAIQQNENYLYMEVAKRHANDHIHFRKGRFTTCDLEEPHYHFQLSKAVMIPEKRIVSGPMNLWIKGVPTPLGLPFSVIPQAEGKTKGLIFPEIIPLSAYGFGFQNIGYFLPINDKLQTTFYATLYSRGSWGFRNRTDYMSRYKFKGEFDLGFQQFRPGFPDTINKNKFSLQWTHRKDPKSNPYWTFGSNINFISDNNSQNSLDPLNPNYFNNSFNSDMNISRSFPGKPITAGAKISLRQNSITKNMSLASPIVNVNVSRFFPFKNLIKGRADNGFEELVSRLGVTYSFEGQNKALFEDTLVREGNFSAITDKFKNGMNHNVSVTTTAGLFKNTWKLTPSIQYGNKLNFQQVEKTYFSANDSTSTVLRQKPGMAHFLSLNTSLTTVLYSYYRYIGKNKPILRHVLTPSFSFRYMPNLSTTETLIQGADTLTYSPFEQSLYKIGSTRDQALIGFGFNNTFELKRKSEKDTVDGFKRTRLIDAFSVSGNYDLMKDSMNLSNLRLNMRISPTKWMNFVATSTFNPYGWIDSTGASLSDYAVQSNGKLGRFTTTNFATTVTLTSKQGREKLDNAIDNIEQNWNADYEYFLLHPEHILDFNIPWKVSLSHIYTLSANTSISSTNTERFNQLQTLMLNGDVSFTKRWKLSTVTNFDVKDLGITNARLSLTRNMHCWALAFHWTPIGGNKSFLFTIRSTSALFRDAKIDIRKPPAFL
ncbi:MAG: LPS-assembly protein LptD [Crocinitomicaceae bacterium]|nr:LPS-assembly protein LptD [Crocinitomicaceae bacterium]